MTTHNTIPEAPQDDTALMGLAKAVRAQVDELCRAECYEGGTGGRVHYCGLAKGHEGNCQWDLEGK